MKSLISGPLRCPARASPLATQTRQASEALLCDQVIEQQSSITGLPVSVSLSAAILFGDAGISVVWPDVLALAVIGLVFFAIALMRFRKSLTS